MTDKQLAAGVLGQAVTYRDTYDPSLLYPIARAPKREALGVAADDVPFSGVDVWHAYELSWLNPQGKPCVALARVVIGADSECIVESKSFKLYLNTYNQTVFVDQEAVRVRMQEDIGAAVSGEVAVTLFAVDDPAGVAVHRLPGRCLDTLDVTIDTYSVDPSLLQLTGAGEVTETWYSHLLKSNCLVTGQPDWGSIVIEYRGPEIAPDALLRYLISYRQHNEFHEQCVERVFMDLLTQCQASELTVKAFYTRRGGLDINPMRSTQSAATLSPWRLLRQ